MSAASNAFATGHAAIGIAPSANHWPAPSGSNTVRQNFSTASTFTSSSPCRIEIAAIAYQNKEVVYNILFQATAETLRTIAADPKHLGAEIGFFAVLHTWGSALLHHPHLHCVVPGGGLSPDGTRWIPCKPGFFLPVRVLSRIIPPPVSGATPERLRSGKLQFFTALESLRDRRAFVRYLEPLEKGKVGRLCQAALRRPRTGAGLCRPLHPSRRDLEQPPARYRSRSSKLPKQDSLLKVKCFRRVEFRFFEASGSIPPMVLGRAVCSPARPFGSSSEAVTKFVWWSFFVCGWV